MPSSSKSSKRRRASAKFSVWMDASAAPSIQAAVRLSAPTFTEAANGTTDILTLSVPSAPA
jgi:hypothetical protein